MPKTIGEVIQEAATATQEESVAQLDADHTAAVAVAAAAHYEAAKETTKSADSKLAAGLKVVGPVKVDQADGSIVIYIFDPGNPRDWSSYTPASSDTPVPDDTPTDSTPPPA